MTVFWHERAIYLVKSGSHAYGTNLPTSDLDQRGVCIPPREYILGLRRWEQHEQKEPDLVIYSLHKFVSLALDCNPNIIELLHVRESEVLRCTEAGLRLRDNAHLFLSRRAFKTFGGYAFAQLRKLNIGKTARHGSHQELVAEFGYDTKNAMHLIRLLRMGVEILSTGTVHTYRSDAEELLDIRHGKWTLDRVLEESDRLNEALRDAHAASTLPEQPDVERADRLVIELTAAALEGDL